MLLVIIAIPWCIILTMQHIGVVWDEPTYMRRGSQYIAWMQHPSLSTIQDYWSLEDIHPPLHKILGGLTNAIAAHTLHKTQSVVVGYRLSTVLLVIPFIAAFLFFAYRLFGITMAVLSTLMVFLLPHVFYHTHLFTLDMAMTVWWFSAFIIVISKKIRHRIKLLLLSLVIAAATLTKFSGVFLCIPVGIWLYWEHLSSSHQKTLSSFNLKPILQTLADGVILTVQTATLFVAGWPYLWVNPILHMTEFITKQLDHHFIPIYYLGQTYLQAPWHYPFVMFFVTTPVPILILFCLGAGAVLIRGTALERFILVNAVLPMAVVALPQSPKYDSVRLFLPSFPFIVLTVCIGIQKIASVIKTRTMRRGWTVGAAICCLISSAYALCSMYPNTFAYYNSIVGGLRGAEKYGFEREYWGSSLIGLLPYLNANPRKDYCAYPVTDMFPVYVQEGLLSPEIYIGTDRTACRYLILLEREGFLQDPEIIYIRSHMPIVKTIQMQGIPLVSVYRLK